MKNVTLLPRTPSHMMPVTFLAHVQVAASLVPSALTCDHPGHVTTHTFQDDEYVYLLALLNGSMIAVCSDHPMLLDNDAIPVGLNISAD